MAAREPDFRGFVTARSPALMRTAFLLTGNWQRGEDLLQTAFLHCFRRWDRIEDHEAYVRRTLVRTYAGWRRRRWIGETPTNPLPDRPQCAEQLGAVDLRTDLLRLLASCGRASGPWSCSATTRTWPSPGWPRCSASRPEP